MRLKRSLHTLTHYEFWPWWAFFLPLVPMYFLTVLLTRRILYFSAMNSGIDMGGFFGEKKHEIMPMIPVGYRPTEYFVRVGELDMKQFLDYGLDFPVFVKPNVGERGFEVREIHDEQELESYAAKGFDFIVQEKLNHKKEYGVLAYQINGVTTVSSICEKEFMQVTGDGMTTARKLIETHPRYSRYMEWLEEDFPEKLEQVPEPGELFVVHRIGNHSKGTRFIDRTPDKTAEITSAFHNLMESMPGLDYGRFDLKCDDLDALGAGEFKVFELNGVSSDPGHIYDQSNYFQAIGILYSHWWAILKIARSRIKKGVKTTPLRQFINQIYNHFFT